MENNAMLKESVTMDTAMMVITPADAQEWLNAMPYEHQRSINAESVRFLAEEIQRGRFVQGTQIRIAHCDGRTYLLDGQHRLSAVVAAGIPQAFAVLEETVESLEKMAWIYGNLDIGRRRTFADIANPLRLHTELGITSSQLNALKVAVGFLETGCLRSYISRMHKDEIIQRIRFYGAGMRSYVQAIQGAERSLQSPLLRVSTVAIALLSFKFSAPLAEKRGDLSVVDFWRGVALDDGLTVSDPRKIANRHLLTTVIRSGGLRGNMTTPHYSARLLVTCFNAYMDRRELKIAKVADSTAPINMYGVSKDPADWFAGASTAEA